MPRTFIRTTISEPFPVFYSHVNQKCRRANDPATEGPFYVAGSQFWLSDTPVNRRYAETSAEGLRSDGYTVTVETVSR